MLLTIAVGVSQGISINDSLSFIDQSQDGLVSHENTSSSSSSHAHESQSNITLSSPTPMLHVLHIIQPKVVLPSCSSSNSMSIDPVISSQGIHTRLKTGAITRKYYFALTAIFPEVHYLTLADDSHFSGGFTFIADIMDASKPSTFKQASQIPQWQVAMQEEFDALLTQETWVLVLPSSD